MTTVIVPTAPTGTASVPLVKTNLTPSAIATASVPTPVVKIAITSFSAVVARNLQTSGTGSTSSNPTVTSLSLPIGAGVLADDLIMVVAAWQVTGTGTTFTTPAGFTPLNTNTGDTFTSVGAFYKVSDGSEAGTNITIKHSATGRAAAVSAAFTGVNGFDGAFPAPNLTTGVVGETSQNSPALTGLTRSTDITVLMIGGKQDVTSTTPIAFTQPATYTLAASVGGSAGAGNNAGAALAYKLKSNATNETSLGWTTNEAIYWLSLSAAIEATVGSSATGSVPTPTLNLASGGGNITITSPVAAAAASVPTPLLLLTLLPAASTASASVPTTIVVVAIPAGVTATNVASLPLLKITLFPASAAAAGSVPAVTITGVRLPPSATASTSVPTVIVSISMINSSAAAASVPTVVISLTILPGASSAAASVPTASVTGTSPTVVLTPATAAASVPTPIADTDELQLAPPASAAAFIDDTTIVPTLTFPLSNGAVATGSALAGFSISSPGLAAATAAAAVPTVTVNLLGSVITTSATATARVPIPVVTFDNLTTPPSAAATASSSVITLTILTVTTVTAGAAALTPILVGSSVTAQAAAAVPLPTLVSRRFAPSASAIATPHASLASGISSGRATAFASVPQPNILVTSGQKLVVRATARVPLVILKLQNAEFAIVRAVSVIRATELLEPRPQDEQRFLGWRRHEVAEVTQNLPVGINTLSIGFWLQVNLGPIPIRTYLSVRSINEGTTNTHEWNGINWVPLTFTRTFFDGTQALSQDLPFVASDSFDFNIVAGPRGKCYFEIDTPGLSVTSNDPITVNQPYRIDLDVNCVSNSWQADWMINEIPQLSITSVQPSGSNWRSFTYGGVEATTDRREDFSFFGMAYDLTAKYPLPS